MKEKTEEALAIMLVGTILLIIMGLIGFGYLGEEWQQNFYKWLAWYWY